jgi:DNA-directed RNA polymerase subunit M/transcription elongation factor TFIIS
MTIQGTPEAVQAVANTDNAKSGLPLASPQYPCKGPLRCVDCGTVAEYGAIVCAVEDCYGILEHDGCGYGLIVVAKHQDETVLCPACGAVTPAGERAATIQVKKVKIDKDTGEATYDSDADLEDEVKKAKVKPPKLSDEDAILAAVEVIEP